MKNIENRYTTGTSQAKIFVKKASRFLGRFSENLVAFPTPDLEGSI